MHGERLPFASSRVPAWCPVAAAKGVRLPTEAEWEYAARGSQTNPYWNFPWANEADAAKANWPESKNPYRFGSLPWTTPAGFFDGKLHRKSDAVWSGAQETFQAANGVNGLGLYDMAGNVWQWCTEWYARNYYAYAPATNPPGPATGSPMPDGKPYRCMRGGSWFNGEFGHSRVSNRDPSYFRGPDPITRLSDPDGPCFHIGFRVVLAINAESRPVIKATPVQRVQRNDGGGGGRRSNDQAHAGDQRPPRAGQGGGGGKARGSVGFRLVPPRAQEQLNLTTDQQKQVADLEAEVKATLDKILTAEQQQQLTQMRQAQQQGGGGRAPNEGLPRDGGNNLPSDDRPPRDRQDGEPRPPQDNN